MLGTVVIVILGVAFCIVAWMFFLHDRRNRRTISWADSDFADRCDGKLVVVADTRWGWYDFVTNNVVPVLPEGAEVIWHQVHGSPSKQVSDPVTAIDIDAFWLRRFVVPPQTPYAFVFDGEEYRTLPLYEALHPLKLQGTKRDKNTIDIVARLLAGIELHTLPAAGGAT